MKQSNEIFQVDHPVVQAVYDEENCAVVVDKTQPNNFCVVYFSSHNIYFPNDERTFRERIIHKDYYEWYKTRVKGASKHIFLRDVHKQWYLKGINSRVSTPDALEEFLGTETKGFKVITIGSSAGGYAAVLYGVLLGAERILCFNGQFELNTRLLHSSESIDPVVFRLQETEIRKYYDLRNIIGHNKNIFYFFSMYSDLDILQKKHIKDKNINMIGFRTAHHGIPFLKCALDNVLSLDNYALCALVSRKHFPLQFSLRYSGLWRSVLFSLKLIFTIVIKRFITFVGFPKR